MKKTSDSSSMIGHAKRAERASTVFFYLGVIFSKLRSVGFFLPLVSGIYLTFYSIGYALWLISSQLRPNYPRKKGHWYGFADVKTQYLGSVVVGFAAVASSLAGIFCPGFLIPAAWLFFFSNSLWCMAEYHKTNNPPDYDQDYLDFQQDNYLRYALVTTLMGLVSAAMLTVPFVWPLAVPSIMLIGTILNYGLALLAMSCLISFLSCEPPEPQDPWNGSCNLLVNSLTVAKQKNVLSPGVQLSMTHPPLWKNLKTEAYPEPEVLPSSYPVPI